MSNIKENVNSDFERMLGITYDEFEKFDFDEQQRIINEYHKNHPVINKENKKTLIKREESVFGIIGLNKVIKKEQGLVKKLKR